MFGKPSQCYSFYDNSQISTSLRVHTQLSWPIRMTKQQCVTEKLQINIFAKTSLTKSEFYQAKKMVPTGSCNKQLTSYIIPYRYSIIITAFSTMRTFLIFPSRNRRGVGCTFQVRLRHPAPLHAHCLLIGMFQERCKWSPVFIIYWHALVAGCGFALFRERPACF